MTITETVLALLVGFGCWQTKAHMEKNPQVPSALHLAVNVIRVYIVETFK